MGYEQRKQALHNAIRGWVSYFKYAHAKTHLQALDEWLRKRIRMCIWKSWTGNIRELRNVVERLLILSGDRITASDVKAYVL